MHIISTNGCNAAYRRSMLVISSSSRKYWWVGNYEEMYARTGGGATPRSRGTYTDLDRLGGSWRSSARSFQAIAEASNAKNQAVATKRALQNSLNPPPIQPSTTHSPHAALSPGAVAAAGLPHTRCFQHDQRSFPIFDIILVQRRSIKISGSLQSGEVMLQWRVLIAYGFCPILEHLGCPPSSTGGFAPAHCLLKAGPRQTTFCPSPIAAGS